MKNVKTYYKHLGKLLYKIAIADGIVQQEERNSLHQFVLKDLAHFEKSHDSSGMNQAFYIDFEFDDYDKNSLEANGVINEFKQFIETNMEPGDDALIERSLLLMKKVANAYPKIKEKNIVEQVEQLTTQIIKQKNKQ